MPIFLTSLLLMAIRGLNAVAKFALALYTARYLGLSELGVYGLVVACTTILPAFSGLGTNDWILRKVAGEPAAKAVPLIATRLAMVLTFHAICQPIGFAINAYLGAPVPWPLAILIGAVAVMDHLIADASMMLLFRNHPLFSGVLSYLMNGFWPLIVIAAGLTFPVTRNLECLMLGWLGGLICAWVALAIYVARKGRWHNLGLNWRAMRSGIGASIPFYLKDMSIATGLYLDRFLVSLFLGMELTGVYTFFWSVANMVHNLALTAVFQPHAARLVAAARTGKSHFRAVLRRIEIITGGTAVMIALVLMAGVPLLLPYLNRPPLAAHLDVFNIVLLATLFRLASDSYNYVLLSLHHDRAMAIVSVAAVPLSAALYVLLIPRFGLGGAAFAYLVAAIASFVPRLLISRKYGAAAEAELQTAQARADTPPTAATRDDEGRASAPRSA